MKIKVIPLSHVVVKDPYTRRVIPTEGKIVDDSVFWQRRKAEGDIKIEKIKAVKKVEKKVIKKKVNSKKGAKK